MKFRNMIRRYYSQEQGGEGGSAGGSAGASGADGGENGGGSGADGGEPGDKKSGGMSDADHALLRENMQRKEQNRKLAEELDAAKAQLKRFDGIDPEAVRKLLADQADAERQQLEARGDFDRVKQMMADEHKKEVDSLQARIAELEGTNGKLISVTNELSIGSQFSQSRFITEEMTLTPAKARVIYGDHFDVVDGKVVPFDKPRGAASRTALVDAQGQTLSFDAALKRIVEADPEKDHLLRSKIKPGAGSNTQKVSGSSASSQQSAPTDSISKIAAGLKSAGIKL